MAANTSKPSDPTFRSYSSEQAKIYATHRLSYAQALYETVLNHHSATGSHFGLLLDVGCGPGNAIRDVALSFDQAIGCDAGAAMIEAARELGGKTESGSDIKFEVSPAEEFSQSKELEPASAHWFEMDKFWVEAAKVVKPRSTVALWTLNPSTPNAAKVMEILLRFERETLAPYEIPSNRLSRDMYDDLALPWTIPAPVKDFPQELFVRREWDREGVLSNGESFFGGGRERSVDDLEKGLATASLVTRWREAHPDLAGTEKDVVEQFAIELREALGPDQSTLSLGSGTVILLFKKSEV